MSRGLVMPKKSVKKNAEKKCGKKKSHVTNIFLPIHFYTHTVLGKGLRPQIYHSQILYCLYVVGCCPADHWLHSFILYIHIFSSCFCWILHNKPHGFLFCLKETKLVLLAWLDRKPVCCCFSCGQVDSIVAIMVKISRSS